MKIAIVENNTNDIDILVEKLNNYFEKKQTTLPNISIFTSGEEFLSKYALGAFDTIFTDIFMGELSGVDMMYRLRKIDTNAKVVFCSTSNEFATESYDVGAVGYIKKPITSDAIENVLGKILNTNQKSMDYVTLPNNRKIILKNIVFTQHNNHYIYINNLVGEVVKIRLTQGEFEDYVKDYKYIITCSKGIMVNLFEVTNMDKDKFFMSNGATVPISRRKYKEVSKKYTKFLFEKVRNEI